MTINRGGYPTIIVVFIVGLLAVAVGFITHPVVIYVSAAIFGFLFIFVVFFFRDPDRNANTDQYRTLRNAQYLPVCHWRRFRPRGCRPPDQGQ